MGREWKAVPFNAKLLHNVGETSLRQNSAALENAFINEQGAAVRFPGLAPFATLSGRAPTYLHEWRGDMVAVSNSRMYRVLPDGTVQDVTDVPISGNRRVIMDKTDDELVAAAGAEIVRFAGGRSELLSADAPLSTHVGYVDQYLIAVEVDSGRFSHSEAAFFRTWDPIDTFVANAKPDDLTALLVTPFREVIAAGTDSTEQFERLPSGGSTPFFRRWANGEGIHAPYTLLAADNAVWFVNTKYEFVRAAGQTSQSQGDAIGYSLEKIPANEWEGAWTASLNIQGQKFILLQIPLATNVYDTKGLTLLYDVRQRRWSQLFGWDADVGVPALWPGYSYYQLWGRHFVGGLGKILELKADTSTNDGAVQRALGRTGHIDSFGESEVLNVRLRIKRGVGAYSGRVPRIGLRARLDNSRWTRWRYQDLGRPGDGFMFVEFGPMGQAHTWQFEWMCTDAAEVEIHKMEAQVNRIGF